MEAAGWPNDVAIEDLSYSAHRVMHTLQELKPERLVLVGATSKGRAPGEITVYRLDPDRIEDEGEVVSRLGESVGGVIDLDHVIIVNHHFGTLPEDTVVIEIEAGDESFGTGYSAEVEAAIPRMLELIAAEVLGHE